MMLPLSPSSEKARAKVIAAIPCLNTEPFVREGVSRAKQYVDEVIVIDDGSDDSTAEVARAAGARVISHGANKGYGEAIKSCFEAARASAADILVILDGDGQHDAEQIPRLLAPILQDEAELVIGSRFLPSSQPTSMPGYRQFGIGVITFLFNLGSKTRVSDAQSGFRAYSKNVFHNFPLSEKGMSISIETLEKARKKGVAIKEVPVSCFYPPSSSPFTLEVIRHGLSVALSVVRLRLKSSLSAKKNKRT